jgi:prepilin-type N-terminal cleavage/methylation domain-containing protein
MYLADGSPYRTGWTLIEVLVALALMTILSTLGYKGISLFITTESSIREESQRLLMLNTTFSQIDMDWNLQLARLPPRTSPANTPASESPSTANHALQWEWTPLPGWIPTPTVLPKPPSPIASFLSQRYTIEYSASPQGGVDRLIACPLPETQPASAKKTTPCQYWHLLNHFPVSIEGNGNQSTLHQPHWMRWTIKTPQGTLERLWGMGT